MGVVSWEGDTWLTVSTIHICRGSICKLRRGGVYWGEGVFNKKLLIHSLVSPVQQGVSFQRIVAQPGSLSKTSEPHHASKAAIQIWGFWTALHYKKALNPVPALKSPTPQHWPSFIILILNRLLFQKSSAYGFYGSNKTWKDLFCLFPL